MVGHNVFTAGGEDVVARSVLRFRSMAELTASLQDASFRIAQMYGDWQRGPVTSRSRVLVFVARRD